MKKGSTYTLDDFYSVKKIDAHLHYYTDNDSFIQLAQSQNMRLISINVDFHEIEWMPLAQQNKLAQYHKHNFPDTYFYIGAVPMNMPLSLETMKVTAALIPNQTANGAIGVKIWKNVGMKFKYNNELILIDNPIFKPLLDKLEKSQIPLLGHFGEPLNCWLPIEEMTVESDRRYYASHPEFHMHLHPDMPSHGEHIDACNRMLSQHPRLCFIGAHLASSEYSITEIAKRLDAYPNLYMDMAERVCHLQHQAVNNHEAVRNFMIKYQDRLLYGSDMVFTNNKSEEEQLQELERRWLNQWRFFTQEDEQTTWQVIGSFKGLGLPSEVVDKIYYHNARKAYPLLKNG